MQKSSWRRRLRGLGTTATLIAVVILVIAGPGHRFGIVPVKFAVYGSALAALIAVFALLITLISTFLRRAEHESSDVVATAATVIVASLITAQLALWINTAFSVPPIHDITTDTDNPPAFDALAGARANAPNPVAYSGAEAAAKQREAYPEIKPLILAGISPADALDLAESAAQEMGWDPIIVSPADSRLEATDTTFWFGYKDDIVVRATAQGSDTRLDIRSKSRVGQSDLGTNAGRIRAYGAAIKAQADN